MSYVRIYIHLVFSTKNREPFFETSALRRKVFSHMLKNARDKDIWVDTVNGYTDHVHCLISLGNDHSISRVAKMIKGESSFWINQQQLTENAFAWQDGYWAVSVGENELPALRKYIREQEVHHQIQTIDNEIEWLCNPHK